MSYLEIITKDILNLLSHYTHRGNWEIFKDLLDDISCLDYSDVNWLLQRYKLRSYVEKHYRMVITVHVDIEDVITDEILGHIIAEFARSLRAILAIGGYEKISDYNSRLEAVGLKMCI